MRVAEAQAASPPPSNSTPAQPPTSHPARPNFYPPQAAGPSFQTPDGNLQEGVRERERHSEGGPELTGVNAELAVGPASPQGRRGGVGDGDGDGDAMQVLEPAPKRQARGGGGGSEVRFAIA